MPIWCLLLAAILRPLQQIATLAVGFFTYKMFFTRSFCTSISANFKGVDLTWRLLIKFVDCKILTPDFYSSMSPESQTDRGNIVFAVFTLCALRKSGSQILVPFFLKLWIRDRGSPGLTLHFSAAALHFCFLTWFSFLCRKNYEFQWRFSTIADWVLEWITF